VIYKDFEGIIILFIPEWEKVIIHAKTDFSILVESE
tara:strand:+ start:974 stop:1081 length:108 start_codon:yes stop_codon:yes gene_type:complete